MKSQSVIRADPGRGREERKGRDVDVERLAVLQESGTFLPRVPGLSELAEAHIQRHHHHESQDGGPGGQLPVATRRKGEGNGKA